MTDFVDTYLTGAKTKTMLYDPYDYRRSRRSVVMAPKGMVATSQPLAAQAGVEILKQGGNAIDAAIAVNAVLGVVEPMSCGIGGDLFAIVWMAEDRTLNGINASGRAPYAATIEHYKSLGFDYIPDNGPLNWSVPGCVDGWACLLQRFGKMSLEQVLEPAIAYAKEGFPVSDIIARDWAASASLLKPWHESARVYLPGGQAPEPGAVFRNPDLAQSYRLLAEGGRDVFYQGELAKAIISCSREVGGLFCFEDFRNHVSTFDDPVSIDYRGHTIWELPPSGQGIAALQMLNILEGYDLNKMGSQSVDTLHVQIEAKKLAYADRALFYADPAFSDVPVESLLSKEYAERQRGRIHLNRAASDVPPGDPILQHGDTAYMTVVDEDRNVVSFIQSIFRGFGSGIVPKRTGFPIQNRGQLFSLDSAHRNALVPHKRPFHTIIPAMVTQNGNPWLTFGLMGGAMQPQGHTQVLCNMIDFGMDVQEAGDAPRFQHFGSAEPTGAPMDPGGGRVNVEAGIKEETIQRLVEKGHHITQSSHGYGGYQAIRIDADTGMLHGASEPRKDGCAIGY